MDNHQEPFTDITDLIPIWAEAWAKEKGTAYEWVEHTGAGVKEHQTSFFKSKSESKPCGLSFSLLPIAVGNQDNAENAPTSAQTHACSKGESITKSARKIQEQSQDADKDHKLVLSGHIMICLKQKIKLENTAEAHKKYSISIHKVYEDLQRFATLDNDAIISSQSKKVLQTALQSFEVSGDALSFVLPKFDNKAAAQEGIEESSTSSAASVTPIKSSPPQETKKTPTPLKGVSLLKLLGITPAKPAGNTTDATGDDIGNSASSDSGVPPTPYSTPLKTTMS